MGRRVSKFSFNLFRENFVQATKVKEKKFSPIFTKIFDLSVKIKFFRNISATHFREIFTLFYYFFW